MNPRAIPIYLFFLLLTFAACQPPADVKEGGSPVPRIPVMEVGAWRICEMPDLDSLNGPDLSRQHVVDHGFIQAENGTWQLWACIRGTKVGRLLYGWEGHSLEEGPWQPTGVKARALEEFGEKTQPAESIQAPHFLKIDGVYHCFYNSNGIRLMTSEDGVDYTRKLDEKGSNVLYEKGGRDVMVMRENGLYYAYSTISTVYKDGWNKGFGIVRTSPDLVRWSDYTIVTEGGRAGNGVVSAESLFVIKVDGYFYLFRSSSITGTVFVYRSLDPYNFGVNDDSKLIAELPIKAPEIILHEGQYYISDLADFQGIKLAKLRWEVERM